MGKEVEEDANDIPNNWIELTRNLKCYKVVLLVFIEID